MYNKYNTSGIVFRSLNEGIDNKKLSIITSDFGCVEVSAQSIRSMKSKLRSSSQVFSFGEFSLVRGKYDWKLVGASSDINFFEIFKNNEVKKSAIHKIFVLLKKVLTGEEENRSIFDSLKDFLFFIKKSADDLVIYAEYIAVLKILKHTGFLGELNLAGKEVVFGPTNEESILFVKINKTFIVKLINNSINMANLNK